MSEKDKKTLEEMTHIEQLDYFFELKMKPINRNQNLFFSVVLGCFAFFFTTVLVIQKDVQAKANTVDVDAKFDKAEKTYLQKLTYYQMEVNEHSRLLEAFGNHQRTEYIFREINDNIENSLGFKYTMRGGLR